MPFVVIRKIKLNQEGINLIFIIFSFTFLFSILAIFWDFTIFKVIYLISASILIFVIYFFRDPDRAITQGDNLILAPADGRVIKIEQTGFNELLGEAALKVSIFLSLFDVHVNRIPISGRINYFEYTRGSFFPAFFGKASLRNEQASFVIVNEKCRVLLRQIAGFLARRIVCNVKEAEEVEKGERFGIIRFGSRIDLFLPSSVNLCISTNQKVKAGVTIVGEVIDEIN